MPRPKLYIAALSHLDTQWRWTAHDTVREFLPATVVENDTLFDRFPNWVLSFEGSARYRLIEEYHPHLFEIVRKRVAEGRWYPAGAAVEAFDALLPAPESVLRQVLYGSRWFERSFGSAGRDLLLADCFGFPAILPTLAVHAGLVGFSTQKLLKDGHVRSAAGIPFAFGRWIGPDGAELLAALGLDGYSNDIEPDAASAPTWRERFEKLRAAGGGDRLLYFVGTGDRGGGVPEQIVAHLEQAVAGRGEIEIIHGGTDRIFTETDVESRRSLPSYRGELLLTLHATGCYTAKAAMKRWNRIGERLGRAAEAAWSLAVARGVPAPLERFERAWTLLLSHQMHDDLTGTSVPAAYRLSLEDLGFVANEFSELLLHALDRMELGSGDRNERVVLSTVAGPRSELAELALEPAERPVSAAGASGGASTAGVMEPLPVQIIDRPDEPRRALVPVACAGVEALVVRTANSGPSRPTTSRIEVAPDRLESDRYRARFDSVGRLTSLFDQQLGRELLRAPLELELLPNRSRKYPAWEIRWEDSNSRPLARVDRRVGVDIVESGPLRAALRIERRARACRVVERWSLAAVPWGEVLLCEVELDWHARGRLLKARFPFTAQASSAHFDTGLAGIERPLAGPGLYEVPAQNWAALEDPEGEFSVAVFADARQGWDQPEPGTLRMSWIHAPRASYKFRHQATHDSGRHRFRYAIGGFSGAAVAAGTIALAADRFAHPLIVARARPTQPDREGACRRRLLDLDPPARLLAAKPAEEGDAVVIRFANAASEESTLNVRTSAELGEPVAVDALERPRTPEPGGPENCGSISLPASGLASLRCGVPRRRAVASTTPLSLPWNGRGFTVNGNADALGFDGRGHSFPLESTPLLLDTGPVPFDLRHLAGAEPHLLTPAGQELALPGGPGELFPLELWLLAAALDGDRTWCVDVDGQEIELVIPDWRTHYLEESRFDRVRCRWHLRPEAFRRAPVAFASGHLHDRAGSDLLFERGSLFAVGLTVSGADRARLAPDPRVRVVAATLTRGVTRQWRDGGVPLAVS